MHLSTVGRTGEHPSTNVGPHPAHCHSEATIRVTMPRGKAVGRPCSPTRLTGHTSARALIGGPQVNSRDHAITAHVGEQARTGDPPVRVRVDHHRVRGHPSRHEPRRPTRDEMASRPPRPLIGQAQPGPPTSAGGERHGIRIHRHHQRVPGPSAPTRATARSRFPLRCGLYVASIMETTPRSMWTEGPKQAFTC